jgi:hypothetical protein
MLGYGLIPYRPKSALGAVSCGKSCIRFSSLDRVDVDELHALLRDAVTVTEAGRNDYYAA